MLSLKISHPEKLKERERSFSAEGKILPLLLLFSNSETSGTIKDYKTKRKCICIVISRVYQLRNQGETSLSQKDQSISLYFVGYTNKLKLETERKGGPLLLLDMKSERSWMRMSQNAHWFIFAGPPKCLDTFIWDPDIYITLWNSSKTSLKYCHMAAKLSQDASPEFKHTHCTGTSSKLYRRDQIKLPKKMKFNSQKYVKITPRTEHYLCWGSIFFSFPS